MKHIWTGAKGPNSACHNAPSVVLVVNLHTSPQHDLAQIIGLQCGQEPHETRTLFFRNVLGFCSMIAEPNFGNVFRGIPLKNFKSWSQPGPPNTAGLLVRPAGSRVKEQCMAPSVARNAFASVVRIHQSSHQLNPNPNPTAHHATRGSYAQPSNKAPLAWCVL